MRGMHLGACEIGLHQAMVKQTFPCWQTSNVFSLKIAWQMWVCSEVSEYNASMLKKYKEQLVKNVTRQL